jgi:hypothetical protein
MPGYARMYAEGFAALGLPYVWGGGGSGAGANNGCGRGGADFNSCGTEIGSDCSGLTAYVLAQAGSSTPDSPGGQRADGAPTPWELGQPETSSDSPVTSRSTSAPLMASGRSWKHPGSAHPSTSGRSPEGTTTTNSTGTGLPLTRRRPTRTAHGDDQPILSKRYRRIGAAVHEVSPPHLADVNTMPVNRFRIVVSAPDWLRSCGSTAWRPAGVDTRRPRLGRGTPAWRPAWRALPPVPDPGRPASSPRCVQPQNGLPRSS